MARYRQRQVFGGNAAAIVADTDEADAALFQVDVDASRAGVQGVFDQFLDDGSRSFDDFASGDLIDEGVG
jgi:hypothetical protein